MAEPHQVALSNQDEKGKKSRLSFYMPDTMPYTEVVTYAQGFAQRMDVIITGAITAVNVTQSVTLSGVKAAPALGSDVEEKMRMSYKTEFNHTFSYALPTFNEDFAAPLFGEQARIYDFLEPEPTEFYNYQVIATDPAYGFSDKPCDKRGEALTVIKKTRQTFYRSRT